MPPEPEGATVQPLQCRRVRSTFSVARALLLALAWQWTSPAAAACIDPPAAIPRETLKALARGFNLDGWLAGPQSIAPDLEVLRALRQAGMSHVRLPVAAELVMRRFSSASVVSEQLKAIEAALRELLSLGYRVSVDLHPGERFNRLHRDDPAAALEALQDAWGHLAPVLAGHPPEMLLAELLNEPDIAPQRWQQEAEALAGFVRLLLPRTTLVVGPVNWQRADSLPNFQPLRDPNVVYAIHFYDPMAFTHQGYWDPAQPLSEIIGLPFPIRADDPAVTALRQRLIASRKQKALEELDGAIAASKPGDLIDRMLEPAVKWQRQYARPLIVNEFGVLKGGAPPDARARWLHAVVDAAERNCWGWAHWEFNQGFGLLDSSTGEPDPAVMRALLQPR
jgi:endoglucanase